MARRRASLEVYQVVPRNVDQNYVANIGMAFGLTDTTKIYQDGSKFYMMDMDAQPPSCQDADTDKYLCDGSVVPTKFLEVDAASGGFSFMNLGELWTKPTMARTLPTSAEQAQGVSAVFSRVHANSLPGFSRLFAFNCRTGGGGSTADVGR